MRWCMLITDAERTGESRDEDLRTSGSDPGDRYDRSHVA